MKILAVICVVLLLPVLAGCDVVLTANHQKPEIYAFVRPAKTAHDEQMIQGLASGGEELQANMEIHEIDLTEEPDDAIRQVKAAVRRSTRAIIITPFENDELQKQLKKAREKGISLIYLDAVQSYEIPGTYIVTDDEAAGEKAGHLLAESMGGEGKAVILSTWPDDQRALDREKGFQEALGEYDDIKLVNLFYCNGEEENTKKTLQDILTAHPDIKGIFAACPKTASAAVKEAAGRSQDIQIVGFHHTDETLELIRNGQMYGSVSLKSFEMGVEAVKAAVSMVSDPAAHATISLDCEIRTRDSLYGAGEPNSPTS